MSRNEPISFDRFSPLFSVALVTALAACNGSNSPSSGGGLPTTCEVIDTPDEAGLDAMYPRYINCAGLAIVGTEGVDDAELVTADETLEFLLTGNDHARDSLAAADWHYVLRGPGINISDLPEGFTEFITDEAGVVDPSKSAGTSPARELRCEPDGIPVFGNSFLHEMVHMMQFSSVEFDSPENAEIIDAYDAAMGEGLWSNTYAAFNFKEYFAETTQIWFEVGRPAGPADGDGLANDVNTRDELLAYDPTIYAIISSWFNSSFDVPGCVHRNEIDVYQDPGFSCPATAADHEGNTYPVVRIANQCWMASNLEVTSYADGTPIPELTDDADWAAAMDSGRCAYDNDTADVATHGLLYNHRTVTAPGALCPDGMRVPSREDVGVMIDVLASYARRDTVAPNLRVAGGAWNGESTDDHGFSAYPTGTRAAAGFFWERDVQWGMWTTDEDPADAARGVMFGIHDTGDYFQASNRAEQDGWSVRCVAD